MATIALEGMRFYAHHGYYEEERIIGNYFMLDVYIDAKVEAAGKTDDLFKTINYETIFRICKMEMRTSSALLESVIERIVQRVKFQFPNIQKLEVKLRKTNPPMGASIDHSLVHQTYTFEQKCPRCSKGMVCYNDAQCWCCNEKQIFAQTQDQLKVQFGNKCLCSECLTFYAG